MKKLKGIGRETVKQHVSFDDYCNTLLNGVNLYRTNYNLNSKNHEVFLSEVKKKALSPFDDKRIIANNGIQTFPFGIGHNDQIFPLKTKETKCRTCDLIMAH